jgi:hypothetical protein
MGVRSRSHAVKRLPWLILIGLGLAGWNLAGMAHASDELLQRAAVIKPAPDELNWQRIPWITDLAEGLRLARQERRPIFLWATGNDPLERC